MSSVAQIDTACDVLRATTAGVAGTDAAGIWLGELDAVTLENVVAGEGIVSVTSGGTMTATNVAGGGNGSLVQLTATAGDIIAGAIDATGDTAMLRAPPGRSSTT